MNPTDVQPTHATVTKIEDRTIATTTTSTSSDVPQAPDVARKKRPAPGDGSYPSSSKKRKSSQKKGKGKRGDDDEDDDAVKLGAPIRNEMYVANEEDAAFVVDGDDSDDLSNDDYDFFSVATEVSASNVITEGKRVRRPTKMASYMIPTPSNSDLDEIDALESGSDSEDEGDDSERAPAAGSASVEDLDAVDNIFEANEEVLESLDCEWLPPDEDSDSGEESPLRSQKKSEVEASDESEDGGDAFVESEGEDEVSDESDEEEDGE